MTDKLMPCPYCGHPEPRAMGRGSGFIYCMNDACQAEMRARGDDAEAEQWNTRPPLSDDKLSGLVETLFSAIAHGDDDHRAWLKEAIDAHFAGQPVPEPRGKGRKEAEIEAQQLRVMREALTSIAEGNLGPFGWQASYDRIREVARKALSTPEGE